VGSRIRFRMLMVFILIFYAGSEAFAANFDVFVEYHYAFLGSRILGSSAWELECSHANNSMITENFTYSVTLEKSWRWSISVSLLETLGLGYEKEGTKSTTKTFRIFLPPKTAWFLYKRVVTEVYYYKYWTETVRVYSDGIIEVIKVSPPMFSNKVVSSEETRSEYKKISYNSNGKINSK